MKKERLSKSKLAELRKYRSIMINVLMLISFVSLWIKVARGHWVFNDIMPEVINMFIIVIMLMLANIKNDFPIFNSRKFKFTKELTYSITTFFSLVFVFIVYKNMVEPDFVRYIASLSLHNMFSVLVFLFPFSLFIIYLIYFSFKCFDGNVTLKKSKALVYDDDTERSLNRYKVLAIKEVTILNLLSIWAKIGLNHYYDLSSCLYEIVSISAVVILFIIGNKKNKLDALHNFHFKIDKYFFISLLLPYILMGVYAIFSTDFRNSLTTINLRNFISLIVYITPMLSVGSLLFYLGSRQTEVLEEFRKEIFDKKNKAKFNSLLSIFITFIILIGFLYYSLNNILVTYSIQNILQVILVFLPLALIVYLVILSGISEINK